MLESGCKMLWKVAQSKGELARGLCGIEQGCSMPYTVALCLCGGGNAGVRRSDLGIGLRTITTGTKEPGGDDGAH